MGKLTIERFDEAMGEAANMVQAEKTAKGGKPARLLAAGVLLAAALACAGRGGDANDQPASGRASGATGPSLVGRWELAAERPPAYGPGLRITLDIDSVASDSVIGRVVFMFSGNVGIDPARFQPLAGRIDADTVIHLVANPVQPDGPRLRFVGRVAQDSIALRELWVGPDDVARGEARWWLIKN